MSEQALREHRAQEAKRLLADETFIAALAAVSMSAKNSLVTVDADDKTAILRLQQKCVVVDEILTELEAAIIAGQPEQEQAVPL